MASSLGSCKILCRTAVLPHHFWLSAPNTGKYPIENYSFATIRDVSIYTICLWKWKYLVTLLNLYKACHVCFRDVITGIKRYSLSVALNRCISSISPSEYPSRVSPFLSMLVLLHIYEWCYTKLLTSFVWRHIITLSIEGNYGYLVAT